MKKILFIKPFKSRDTIDDSDWNGIEDSLSSKQGGEFDVLIADFNQLIYLADGKQSKIWHATLGYDIAGFDLVVIRRVGDEMEKAISIAHYLNGKRRCFIDTYLLTQGKGKLSGAFLRSSKGIPVPHTVWCASDNLDKIAGALTFPLVAKADNGRKGKDNYLVYDFQKLKDIVQSNPDTMYVLQPFIENDGDYRILVLNGKPSLAIHRKGAKGSHLNNTSSGGTASITPVDDLDAKLLKTSVSAARHEELQVAGVDIIIDKQTSKYYVLEVNRAPQLATGAFTDQKLEAYAGMISDLVGGNPVEFHLPILGSVEDVQLADEKTKVKARVDTGAKTSAVWASDVKLENGLLHYRLFGPTNRHYSGKVYTTKRFSETAIASSNSIVEKRYKVKMNIDIAGRKIKGSFTLADRKSQVYPVLVGRNILSNKFIVDVKFGKPLHKDEKRRTGELRKMAKISSKEQT